LGWSHGDEEIFSRLELLDKFDLEHIGRAPGVFNPDKLLWLNSHYLRQSDNSRLARDLLPFFEARGVAMDLERLAENLEMFKERAKTLVELTDQALFIFTPVNQYDPKGERKLFKPETADLLDQLGAMLAKSGFDEGELESLFRSLAEEKDLKLGAVAQPVRLALTGRTVSPGLFEVMTALGKDETLVRIGQAAEYIRARTGQGA
jgi:glutamyl-tRNA synthetase